MSKSFKGIDAVCLTQLLRSALGHGVNLATYRFLREDEDYAVVAATLTHPPQQIVIKLAGPHAALAPAFERTAAIARLVCSRSAVPTFEVIAVDGSFRLWPWQYLVTTFLPGQQWSETRARKSNREVHILHASLGTTIGQLHTIGFSSCGEIALDGNVVAGTTYYAALMERAQRRIANPAHVALDLRESAYWTKGTGRTYQTHGSDCR